MPRVSCCVEPQTARTNVFGAAKSNPRDAWDLLETQLRDTLASLLLIAIVNDRGAPRAGVNCLCLAVGAAVVYIFYLSVAAWGIVRELFDTRIRHFADVLWCAVELREFASFRPHTHWVGLCANILPSRAALKTAPVRREGTAPGLSSNVCIVLFEKLNEALGKLITI